MQALNRFFLSCVLLLVSVTAQSQDKTPFHPRGLSTNATFDGADVRDIFLSFFRHINASFVLDPKVHGHVTADYKSVPTFDIIDDLARRVNAVVSEKDGIYYVLANEKNPPKKEDPRSLGSFVFYFRDTSLERAVHALGEAAGTDYATSIEVNAQGVVTLDGAYDSFTDAIKAVVDSCDATLLVSRTKFFVYPGSYLQTPHWAFAPVVIKAHKTAIRDALKSLFSQVNVEYTITPEVQGFVSGSFSGPFLNALNELLLPVRAMSTTGAGVIQIVSIDTRDRYFGRTSSLPPVSLPAEVRSMKTPRNLVFKKTDVQDVLKKLFAVLPGRYWIHSDERAAITADISEMRLEAALSTIVNQAKLRVILVDGVYIFSPRTMRGIDIRGGPESFIFKPSAFRLDP